MKRILITGFTGFVSNYLVEHLLESDEDIEIIGISRSSSFDKTVRGKRVHVLRVDLNDRKYVEDLLSYYRPNEIFHLASDSSVSYSWNHPVSSFQNNTNIFLNLIESVRLQKLDCKILSVGSSEEYGVVETSNLPLTEDAPLNPVSPYAVARVSQELLSRIYAKGYGLNIVLTRSFNHIGPGQKNTFVISSFARQIAELRMGATKHVEAGDLTIIRDFLDVRDVVKAYMRLMQSGVSGEVYNVCSGNGFSLEQVLDKLRVIAEVDFSISINPAFLRPADNPVIIGSNKKIREACDWSPIIELEESLKQMVAYWERIVDPRKTYIA